MSAVEAHALARPLRRALVLEGVSTVWRGVEGGLAAASGIAAHNLALASFGWDSLIGMILAGRARWRRVRGRSRSNAVRAYLGLGTNLGDRASMLARARALLEDSDLRIVAASRVYETSAWGGVDQPPFLNQVLEVRTRLEPRALLERSHRVEASLGRVRSMRWGPRTIDVDILLYGTLQVSEPDLVIPHPQMTRRAFVLVPLSELDASVRVPGRDTVQVLLDALPDRGDVKEYRGRPEMSSQMNHGSTTRADH